MVEKMTIEKSAIKYLLEDDTVDPRFRTFEDFVAWGKTIGKDFSGCRECYDFVQALADGRKGTITDQAINEAYE